MMHLYIYSTAEHFGSNKVPKIRIRVLFCYLDAEEKKIKNMYILRGAGGGITMLECYLQGFYPWILP